VAEVMGFKALITRGVDVGGSAVIHRGQAALTNLHPLHDFAHIKTRCSSAGQSRG